MLASTRRSFAIALTLSLALPATTVLAPSTALAQARRKPVRDQLPPEARKQWDIAMALYNDGKWDAARASFNAAFDASHNPRVLFNVAVCEKNMGRYGRAIDELKRILDLGKGMLSADEESEIRAQMSGLQQFIAQLTIDVNEPGADVYVDDQKIGTSPLKEAVPVSIGERRVRASKPGFADAIDTVELKGGGSGKLTLTLLPSVKRARVTVNIVGPKSADVYIDGKMVGTAGMAPYQGEVTVSPEPHQFSAQASGFVTASQSAVVREGEAQTLTIQMSADQQKGKLLVSTRPEGATIEIDGKTMGATRWEGPVDVGTHQIVVKKQGFYQWTYDVDVPRGGERSVTASLNEDRNTSFVPWLIGTVLVIGASATAAVLIAQPKDQEKVNGTLAPFTVGTPSLRWH